MNRAYRSPGRPQPMRLRFLSAAFAVIAVFGVLGACPENGCIPDPCELDPSSCASDPNEPARPVGGTVQRVVISPGSVLLTVAGQTTRLTAEALDTEGKRVDAAAEWATSDGATVQVDAEGLVTAIAELG